MNVLRPLSTSELLDRTFHLYRNHFGLFVGIAAIPQLAVFAVRLGYVEGWIRTASLGRFGQLAVIWMVSFIALEISHAATALAVSSLHLNREIAIGSAYSAAKGSLLRVIWISFVAFILPLLIAIPVSLTGAGVIGVLFLGVGETSRFGASIVGMMVIVSIALLPLRWWLRWALVVPATVLEGGGLRASVRRSKFLTQDRRGRIFVMYVLLAALSMVIGAVCQTPYYLAGGPRIFTHPHAIRTAVRLLQPIGNFLSASLVGALVTISLTLVYFDERVRREGLDLQLMLASLESTAEAPLTSPA